MPPPPCRSARRSIVDISHESLMRRLDAASSTWAEQERGASAHVRAPVAGRPWYAEGAAGLLGRSGARARACGGGATTGRPRPGAALRRLVRRARWRFSIAASRSTCRAAEGERDGSAGGSFARHGGPRRCSVRLAHRRAAGARGAPRRPAGRRRNSASRRTPWTSSCRRPRSTRRARRRRPADEQFRRELLERAKRFYAEFIEQAAANETLRQEMGLRISGWATSTVCSTRPAKQCANTSKPSSCSQTWANQSADAEYRRRAAPAHITGWEDAERRCPTEPAEAEAAYAQRADPAGTSRARQPVA